LKKRGYTKQKVEENLEAEVIGVCQMDALYAFGEEKVYEIDTSHKEPREVVDEILKILDNPTEPTRIDWMTMLEEEGQLKEYLKE
jgi:adenylate kinase